jgi:ATP-dependent Lon protease
MAVALQGIDDPAQLANVISSVLDIPAEDKQALLETFDLKARLDRLLELLARRIEVLKVSRDIADRTRESIGDVNRKHLLREQMRTIQKELGEGEEGATEIAELDAAIGEAQMPEEVEKAARKELRRLERMPEAAGEHAMLRTYLDWLIELPWKVDPEPPIDIAEARRILDDDHFGLDKIKRRILESLAVHKLNPTGRSPILCFVGPPGVGKTSLGQSIAKATGPALRAGQPRRRPRRGRDPRPPPHLCGRAARQCDPEPAQGRHPQLPDDVRRDRQARRRRLPRRPGIGAARGARPEQNATFRDTYLAVPFDLSKVMFVCTANVLDTIPGPLRDRMEVIQLPGYTAQEKLQIARRFLLPRQLEANGLQPGQCEIGDDALIAIIDDYTREPACATSSARSAASAATSRCASPKAAPSG